MVHFVPLQAEHLPLLHTWLARPHAAQWWQPTPSVDELHADYIAPLAEPNATRAYLAHEGDEPVGFIQSYVVMGSGGGWWEDETDPGAAQPARHSLLPHRGLQRRRRGDDARRAGVADALAPRQLIAALRLSPPARPSPHRPCGSPLR